MPNKGPTQFVHVLENDVSFQGSWVCTFLGCLFLCFSRERKHKSQIIWGGGRKKTPTCESLRIQFHVGRLWPMSCGQLSGVLPFPFWSREWQFEWKPPVRCQRLKGISRDPYLQGVSLNLAALCFSFKITQEGGASKKDCKGSPHPRIPTYLTSEVSATCGGGHSDRDPALNFFGFGEVSHYRQGPCFAGSNREAPLGYMGVAAERRYF